MARDGYSGGASDARNGKLPYVPYNTPHQVRENYGQGFRDNKK